MSSLIDSAEQSAESTEGNHGEGVLLAAKRRVSSMWRVRFVRFLCGCSLNVSTKMILAASLDALGIAIWINYAIVHVVIVLIAYAYHSRITFGEDRFSVAGFWRFLSCVFAFKVMDYALVTLVTYVALLPGMTHDIPVVGTFLRDHILVIMIAGSSFVIAVLRYFVFARFAFRRVDSLAAKGIGE